MLSLLILWFFPSSSKPIYFQKYLKILDREGSLASLQFYTIHVKGTHFHLKTQCGLVDWLPSWSPVSVTFSGVINKDMRVLLAAMGV